MHLCETVENRRVVFVISGISSPPLPVNSCMARMLHFLQLYKDSCNAMDACYFTC